MSERLLHEARTCSSPDARGKDPAGQASAGAPTAGREAAVRPAGSFLAAPPARDRRTRFDEAAEVTWRAAGVLLTVLLADRELRLSLPVARGVLELQKAHRAALERLRACGQCEELRPLEHIVGWRAGKLLGQPFDSRDGHCPHCLELARRAFNPGSVAAIGHRR